MFRICFVWVYTIKGFLPLCLACKHRQVLFGVHFYACGRYSPVYPKSFYIKGNKTAYLGFYCRAIFYDNVPSFLYLIVKGLKRLTTFSSRRANVKKRVWR